MPETVPLADVVDGMTAIADIARAVADGLDAGAFGVPRAIGIVRRSMRSVTGPMELASEWWELLRYAEQTFDPPTCAVGLRMMGDTFDRCADGLLAKYAGEK